MTQRHGMKVAFLGHRKINRTEELEDHIRTVVLQLIGEGADTFFFGSKSEFDDLCREIVGEFRLQDSNLKRVYVRAEYPLIDSSYEQYLLQFYEETYFPLGMEKAGRKIYVERNQEMIKQSDVCVFYYNAQYKLPPVRKNSALPDIQRKSGTAIAFEYACRRGKRIINLFEG